MFIDPQQALNALDLRPGMIVADFGCGSGYYSIAAAKKIGPSGKLYAIDIRKEMLEIVRNKAKFEHILNIDTVWADLEIPGSTKIKEEAVDTVIISNALFQIQKKENLISEAFRILKPNGQIIVVEWEEGGGGGGPPAEYRVSRRETERLFKESGLSFQKEFSAGSNHYGLVFKKQ